jgi:hypothetical protein
VIRNSASYSACRAQRSGICETTRAGRTCSSPGFAYPGSRTRRTTAAQIRNYLALVEAHADSLNEEREAFDLKLDAQLRGTAEGENLLLKGEYGRSPSSLALACFRHLASAKKGSQEWRTFPPRFSP